MQNEIKSTNTKLETTFKRMQKGGKRMTFIQWTCKACGRENIRWDGIMACPCRGEY